MSAVGDERGATGNGARGDEPAGAAAENRAAQYVRLFGTIIAPLAAARHVLRATRRLAAAELRICLAGIPLLCIAVIALVAMSVSLWVCLVALVGWALMSATGSLGLALGLLVVIHVVLVTGVWIMITRTIRRLAFKKTRAELHALGQTLLRTPASLNAAARAAASHAPDAAAARKGVA